jgi:hypothetical protein
MDKAPDTDPYDRLRRAIEAAAALQDRVPGSLALEILEHEISVVFDDRRTAAPTHVKRLVDEYLG